MKTFVNLESVMSLAQVPAHVRNGLVALLTRVDTSEVEVTFYRGGEYVTAVSWTPDVFRVRGEDLVKGCMTRMAQ